MRWDIRSVVGASVQRCSRHALPLLCLLSLIGCVSQAAVTDAPTDPPVETATDQATATAEPTTTPEPSAAPTSTPDSEPLFTFHGDAPFIERGEEWDSDIAYPMSIVKHEGLYYFFRNSVNGVIEQTGYSTSPDLITWTPGPANPILTTDALGQTADMLLPWSALKMVDGSWAMYFWSWSRQSSGDSWIGRATAASPDGLWTIDPRRLLEPGEGEDQWDRLYIQSPTVLQTPDGGYVMLYQGSPSSRDLEHQAFGWATSEDGIEWARHGDPVFRRGETTEAWDGRSIQQPHMVHTPDGYVMVYEGSSRGNDMSSYGIAHTADGINWTRHPANPIFTPEDFPQAGFTHISSLFYEGGTYYLLLELGTPNMQNTDIWLATHEGSILP